MLLGSTSFSLDAMIPQMKAVYQNELGREEL
jgi:hypothetical protein